MFQFGEPPARERPENCSQTRPEASSGTHVLPQKNRARLRKIGALEGRVGIATVVPYPSRRNQQDLSRSAADLRRQIRVRPKLAIPLIDLPDCFYVEHPRHERRSEERR